MIYSVKRCAQVERCSGQQQRPAVAASSSGQLQRLAVAASSSGQQQRPAVAASRSGQQQRPAIAARSSGQQQPPAIAASSSGQLQRPAAARYTVHHGSNSSSMPAFDCNPAKSFLFRKYFRESRGELGCRRCMSAFTACVYACLNVYMLA